MKYPLFAFGLRRNVEAAVDAAYGGWRATWRRRRAKGRARRRANDEDDETGSMLPDDEEEEEGGGRGRGRRRARVGASRRALPDASLRGRSSRSSVASSRSRWTSSEATCGTLVTFILPGVLFLRAFDPAMRFPGGSRRRRPRVGGERGEGRRRVRGRSREGERGGDGGGVRPRRRRRRGVRVRRRRRRLRARVNHRKPRRAERARFRTARRRHRVKNVKRRECTTALVLCISSARFGSVRFGSVRFGSRVDARRSTLDARRSTLDARRSSRRRRRFPSSSLSFRPWLPSRSSFASSRRLAP